MELRRLGALIAYCEAPRCRRQTLLSYFGESREPCGHCDLCDDPPELIDGTVLAQKAMSAIARTGQRFGLEHLIAVLRGQMNEKIAARGHDKLPTFGIGQDRSKEEWMSVYRQLFAAGAIDQPVDGHGEFVISAQGKEILFGRETIRLRPPEAGRAASVTKTRAAKPAEALQSEHDRAIYAALRSLRGALARESGKPAYTVFADRTLIEMALHKPASLDALAQIHGVGARKLERYGEAFLKALREAA